MLCIAKSSTTRPMRPRFARSERFHSDRLLDTNAYPKGIKVSKAELAQINLTLDEFHGDWNYTIAPRRHQS